MKITNRLGLPYGFVKACAIEPHNDAGKLSVTTIMRGIKEVLLMERHWEELEDDAADRIWAVFGTAVHKLLETEGADEFVETCLEYKHRGLTITGRIDNYNMREGVITDYKTASTWKVTYKNYNDWKLQGCLYAWLLWKNGLLIKKARFIALLKDHSKTQAQRDREYPQSPVVIYEFEITEKELAFAQHYIEEFADIYTESVKLSDNDIPVCNAEDRWEEPTVFAVMKEGRKSAVRKCNTKEEAEALMNNLGAKHYIEVRQGISRKCAGYCIVKNYCNFYKEKVAPIIGEGESNKVV